MASCQEKQTEPVPIPQPHIEDCSVYTQELLDLPDDYPDRPVVIFETNTPRDAEIYRIRCEIGNFLAKITTLEAELAQFRQELQELRNRRGINQNNWRIQHLILMIEIKERSISHNNNMINHYNWLEEQRLQDIQREIRDRQRAFERATNLVNQASVGALGHTERTRERESRERERQIRTNCRTQTHQVIEAHAGYNEQLWDQLHNCSTAPIEDLEQRYAN